MGEPMPVPRVRPARPRFAYTARDTGGRRLTDTPTERAAEGTWTRLRRRKVVQWGLVYVAAAWGIPYHTVEYGFSN